MGHMKIILIADDDSLVGNLQTSADILISLGDLHETTIMRAANLYGTSRILAVKGNHDLPDSFPQPIENLHRKVVTINGISFGGIGGSWQYKPKGHHLFQQEEVHNMLDSFPAVDVFIAHNSPQGYHERDPDVHQGFEAFSSYILQHQPEYFIHGHQHSNQISKIGKTTVLSVFGEVILNLTMRLSNQTNP